MPSKYITAGPAAAVMGDSQGQHFCRDGLFWTGWARVLKEQFRKHEKSCCAFKMSGLQFVRHALTLSNTLED